MTVGPDVTVIVPVYNTMPYLIGCLDSLVNQTLDRNRIEAVVVDDGSTDGSGDVIDQYAARHPDLFRVFRQPNSGGPASPFNVGVREATGRYMYFLGADDQLNPEALERMVARADEWGSDVVCVKLVGTGGREIGQQLFVEDVEDLPFPDTRPFIFANSKLFRSSLVREHQLSYPEHMRAASDQPFTIEAMLHSRKTSVLADYDYCLGAIREDSANITFEGNWRGRLRDIASVMAFVESIIDAGEVRDLILQRHFRWEMASKLRDLLPELSPAEQTELCAAVADLHRKHWTAGISALLPVQLRLRILLAAAGEVDLIHELNDLLASDGPLDLELTATAAYLMPRGRVRDVLDLDAFEISQHQGVHRRVHADIRELSVQTDAVQLAVDVNLASESAAHLRLVLVSRSGSQAIRPDARIRVDPVSGDTASTLSVTVPTVEIAPLAAEKEAWRVRFEFTTGGAVQSFPASYDGAKQAVRVPGPPPVRVVARPGRQGDRLVLAVNPLNDQ